MTRRLLLPAPAPSKLDCLDNICVVASLLDDNCSVITWDQSNVVNVVGTFPTGNSPKGTDLILLGNGNYGCVIANRNDNSVTVAEIAPNGTVIASNTFLATDACGSPNDAIWMNNGTTDILVTCLSASNVVILKSGL